MARQSSPLIKDQADFSAFMNQLYGSYMRNAQVAQPSLGGPQQGALQNQAFAPQKFNPQQVSQQAVQQQSPSDAAQIQQQMYKAYDPNLKARKGQPFGSDEYKNLVRASTSLQDWYARNVGNQPVINEISGPGESSIQRDASFKSYALDPFTGKLVRQDVGGRNEQVYDPQRDSYSDNWVMGKAGLDPRLLERGQAAFEDVDKIRASLAPTQQKEFDKVYGQATKAYQGFQEKYLPQTLRDQVAQFFPEKLDKGITKFIGNRDYGINTLTSSLAARGITDLSQLAIGKDKKGKNVIYDPKTGEAINSGLWTYQGGSGDGNIQYYLKPNKDGTGVQLATHFEKPEKKGIDMIGDMMPSIILAAAAGPAGATLGSALGAGAAGLGGTLASMGGQAIAQGVAGGLGAAMQGGDIGRGLLTGAVGGALGGAGNLGGKLLGANAPAWQQAAINQGIGGAVKGGLGSYLTGQNIGKGILQGGASGALAGGLGGLGQQAFAGQNALTQGLGKVGTSALTSGLVNRIRGGDFMQGAQAGALGGLGGLAQQQLAGLGRQFGLDPRLSNQLGGLGSRFLMTSLMNRRG